MGSLAAFVAVMISGPASAQAGAPEGLQINDKGYFEAPAVNILAFSNWYDGLFADAKIGGVEIIQRGVRSATNGDVRLSATPGQWDPAAALVRLHLPRNRARPGLRSEDLTSTRWRSEARAWRWPAGPAAAVPSAAC